MYTHVLGMNTGHIKWSRFDWKKSQKNVFNTCLSSMKNIKDIQSKFIYLKQLKLMFSHHSVQIVGKPVMLIVTELWGYE